MKIEVWFEFDIPDVMPGKKLNDEIMTFLLYPWTW